MDVYGLVGNPVGHSVSPDLHEAAYDVLDMDARYVTFEPDPEDLSTAIEGASALGIAGLNVTIPFKEDVLDLVDTAGIANRIGAVNTIDFSTAPPTGYNTDAAGARRALEHHDVDPGNGTAVVIGAGGAARSIVAMLVAAGATVHIVNRTEQRAHELAAKFDATGHPLPSVSTVAEDADLLINATSVGMEEDRSPIEATVLHEDMVVMDAVYAPLETRLLSEARQAGAKTIDGAWMLLYQGVEAFEIWTGKRAPVEPMNEALRQALSSSTSDTSQSG